MRRPSFLGAAFIVVTGCGGDTGTGTGTGTSGDGGAISNGGASLGGASGGGATSGFGGTGGTSGTGATSSTGGTGGTGATSGTGGAGEPMHWYVTCGPPVCRIPSGDGGTSSGSGGTSSGYPACTDQMVGESCTVDGAKCDTGNSCVGPFVCAATDPKPSYGCPVSRAKYKTDIEYLSASERAKLADDVQAIPLVQYRYKDGPERQHLGFIIEDVEPSPGVDSPHDQVDLYGYTSMAVAAIQEQHREIEALKREVAELRVQLSQRARRHH